MSCFARVSRYSIPATWQQFRELPFPILSHKATPHTDKLICQVYYYYNYFFYFGLLVCGLITKQLTKSKSINFLFFLKEQPLSCLSQHLFKLRSMREIKDSVNTWCSLQRLMHHNTNQPLTSRGGWENSSFVVAIILALLLWWIQSQPLSDTQGWAERIDRPEQLSRSFIYVCSQ